MTGSKTYADRGKVFSKDGASPTVTAHIAKNRDEGLII